MLLLLAEQICNGVAKKCGKRYPLKTVCGIVCKICRYLEEENKIKIDFMCSRVELRSKP